MNIIEINKLSFSFTPKKEVLRDIVLNIKRGETLGISGESGCGKSTLAGCLAGLYDVSKDTIIYSDPITIQKGIIRGVHLIFQDPYSSINPKLTVWEAVSEGLRIKKRQGYDDLEPLIGNSLDSVALDRSYTFKKVATLSGGERQKVAIARALILDPALIIFDEATVNLDLISQREILAIIRKLREAGRTMIIISHDERLLSLLAHRTVVMREGKICNFL